MKMAKPEVFGLNMPVELVSNGSCIDSGLL
jgi:hypothetical protein